MTTRTFWLSFIDRERPAGERFLGACIVDVTEEAAAEARAEIAGRFPMARAGAEWIAAAARRAWACGANPGGEVGTLDITDQPEAATAPRNRLLTHPELVALGLVASPTEKQH